MVKILTVAQHEQYPHGSCTVPYGPYEMFLESRIKNAATDLINSPLILLTLHYKRLPLVASRCVLGCSKIMTVMVQYFSTIFEANQDIKNKHSKRDKD
jgi:hypothetical protein